MFVNSAGAFVGRVPRPLVSEGSVLVKVHHSLISTGTETALIDTSNSNKQNEEKLVSRDQPILKKAISNTKLGLKWSRDFAAQRLIRRRTLDEKVSVKDHVPLAMEAVAGCVLETLKDGSRLTSDLSRFGYQALSREFKIPVGYAPAIQVRGNLAGGPISIGVLAGKLGHWVGLATLQEGSIDEQFIFEPGGIEEAVVVIANADAGAKVCFDIEQLSFSVEPPTPDGRPHNEMGQLGWNVGYSLSGEILAVGDGVSRFKVGELVACAGAGAANHAEFVTVKQNLVAAVPAGCDMRSAAVTTVGSIALQGVRRADVGLGTLVCTIGLGLIGQITCQLLTAAGATVIGMDLDPERAKIAKSHGVKAAVNNGVDLKKAVNRMSGENGVDCTIITAAAESDKVINLAMEITRRKGKVVISGDVGLGVERKEFYRKEIDLLMSTSYGPGRYDESYEERGIDYPYAYVRWTENRNFQTFLSLVADGRINIRPLIEKEVELDQAPDVYQELAGSGQKPLAVMLNYCGKADFEERPNTVSLSGHRKGRDSLINYVLVGAGAFGTTMLVPQLQRLKEHFHLLGVVSGDAVRGGNFAKLHAVEFWSSSLDEILKEPRCDAVVIATRHNQHAKEAIASIEAGKHVFLEKPAATSREDLSKLEAAYNSLDVAPIFMVGFNRRFSPAILKLLDILKNRSAPLFVSYRVNGGYIPQNHWIHSEIGGGRNVGEACHMYDVFRALTGAPVRKINASTISPSMTEYIVSDNFCASLSYEDGSLANLLYTSMGPKAGLSKEYIEVFCDGNCYIIDNYESLRKAGGDDPIWSSEEVDKGHFNELEAFGTAVSCGGPAPIPFAEIIETTSAALYIEDLLTGNI